MYPYESEADALADVLRLSKGMTYKNAVADLPLGGGKCVIIADPANQKKTRTVARVCPACAIISGTILDRDRCGCGPR